MNEIRKEIIQFDTSGKGRLVENLLENSSAATRGSSPLRTHRTSPHTSYSRETAQEMQQPFTATRTDSGWQNSIL